MKHFNRLVHLTQLKDSPSFYQFILSSSDKLNSIQSHINLSDQSSISESIDIISSIRIEFKKQFYEQTIIPSKSHSDLKLFESCKMALVIIQTLLTSLQDLLP